MKKLKEEIKMDSKISKEMETFSELLKQNGLKITNQRLLVAQKIFSTHSHFTADNLLEKFRDKKGEISKATIYRILSIMVDAKLLKEHDFGKESKFYEHILGHEHHDHIICLSCDRIVEFTDPKIEELQSQAAESNGFQILAHDLKIYAECKNVDTCKYYKKNKKSN